MREYLFRGKRKDNGETISQENRNSKGVINYDGRTN